MHLLDERSKIRTVAARFTQQFRKNVDTDKRLIMNKLSALDVETATAKDVADIIGNDSWVRPDSCDLCKVESFKIVQIEALAICPNCLKDALALTVSDDPVAHDLKRILSNTVGIQSTMNKILKELKDKS